MPASIEQLKSLIAAKGGVARSNLFMVTLPTLPGATTSELNLLCKDVQLPGRQILTQERQYGMKQYKIAYGYAQEDISMTFHVLNDFGVKKYFETWQSMCIDFDQKEVAYKADYVKDVKIALLKKGFGLPIFNAKIPLPKMPPEIQGRLPKIGPFDLGQGEIDLDYVTPDQKLHEVTLYNAFPTTLNGITLNNENGTLLELNIQLSYDDWKSGFMTQTSTLVDTLKASVIGGIASRIF
jgi:hypothetical protein